jgi:hypothetical protein
MNSTGSLIIRLDALHFQSMRSLLCYHNIMAERSERYIPDWAKKERGGDLAWIHENLHVFWPAAQMGYETVGRGAIVVDTTSRPTGKGHPFGYLDQAAIEQNGDEDAQRMVREYDPTWEFVATLFKPFDRVSTYRVGVIPAIPRENLGGGRTKPN